MEVVILCGGAGSRLSEETVTKPKQMEEIGGKPGTEIAGFQNRSITGKTVLLCPQAMWVLW